VPPRTAPLFVLVIVCVFAGVGGFLQPAKATAANPTRAEKKLIWIVNHARRNHGVRRLSVGSLIQSGAHRWARYLLYRDAFFHASVGSGVTENLAWLTCRRGWARATVRMWLNSSGHRSNLLDRSARKLGVGVATGRWSGYRCVRITVARFR
jgi:uncharacterized protein YkwD